MDDAKGALEVVEQVLNMPGAEPLWEDASAWKKSLITLERQPKPRRRDAKALEAEAARLIEHASARPPTDAGAELFFLRATAVTHELLMAGPSPSVRVQALSWLGQSYRALQDLDIWSLHLVYDAACVQEAPHSAEAAECYQRWRDGARAAFTGNGGGPLPAPYAAQDDKLRALATPRATSSAVAPRRRRRRAAKATASAIRPWHRRSSSPPAGQGRCRAPWW
jgi:hypothetical protein